MAAATKRPTQVAGLHFFNPVPLMQLVEVVKTIVTSQATIDTLYKFAAKVGKRGASIPAFWTVEVDPKKELEKSYILTSGDPDRPLLDRPPP